MAYRKLTQDEVEEVRRKRREAYTAIRSRIDVIADLDDRRAQIRQEIMAIKTEASTRRLARILGVSDRAIQNIVYERSWV